MSEQWNSACRVLGETLAELFFEATDHQREQGESVDLDEAGAEQWIRAQSLEQELTQYMVPAYYRVRQQRSTPKGRYMAAARVAGYEENPECYPCVIEVGDYWYFVAQTGQSEYLVSRFGPKGKPDFPGVPYHEERTLEAAVEKLGNLVSKITSK